jgi:hypothetical protein
MKPEETCDFPLGTKAKLGYSYFIKQWTPIATRNSQEGFPHYNKLYFILKAYPELASELLAKARKMIQAGYSKESVNEFITAYKVPCATVRLHYALLALQVLNVKGPSPNPDGVHHQQEEQPDSPKVKDWEIISGTQQDLLKLPEVS